MPVEPAGTVVVEGRDSLAFVAEVLDAFEQLGSSSEFGADEDRDMFALALSEILTNVVQHSHCASAFKLRVELAVSSTAFKATVVDDADPAVVDWERAVMPDTSSESGRGLALAKTVLDELEHSTTPAGNVWRLVRRL